MYPPESIKLGGPVSLLGQPAGAWVGLGQLQHPALSTQHPAPSPLWLMPPDSCIRGGLGPLGRLQHTPSVCSSPEPFCFSTRGGEEGGLLNLNNFLSSLSPARFLSFLSLMCQALVSRWGCGGNGSVWRK